MRRQQYRQPGPPHNVDPRASYGSNMSMTNQPQVIDPSRLSQPSSRRPRPMPPKNTPRPQLQAKSRATNSAVNYRPQSNNPISPRNRPRPSYEEIHRGINTNSQLGSPRQPNYPRNIPRLRQREIPRGIEKSPQLGFPSGQPNYPPRTPWSSLEALPESNVTMYDGNQSSSVNEGGEEADSYSGFEKNLPASKPPLYTPLIRPPEPWGPFTYNQYGELAPRELFSTQEILQYLYSHPEHSTPEGYTPLSGGLTLRLQRSPVRAVRRCGNPLAGRCRFKDCLIKDNVISEGEMRVAFDEYTKRFPNHNPQHMAAFVHLRCLEQFTQFPKLCQDLSVVAESRVLPSEPYRRNTMILRSPTELLHAERFIDFCRREGRPPRTYSILSVDIRASNQHTLQEELDGYTDAPMNVTLRRRWEQNGREGIDRIKSLVQKRKAQTYLEQKRRVEEEEDEEETQRRSKRRNTRK